MTDTFLKEKPIAKSATGKLAAHSAAELAYFAKFVDEQGWTEKDWQAKKSFESIDRQRRLKSLFAENPAISFRQAVQILMAELLPESASDAETVAFFEDSHKWFEKFKPAAQV